MAHTLAPNLGAGNFHSALVADRAGMANALVLAAIALPVFGGTENALAEKPAMLWLERAVIDGLRLGDLAVRTIRESTQPMQG